MKIRKHGDVLCDRAEGGAARLFLALRGLNTKLGWHKTRMPVRHDLSTSTAALENG